MNTVALKDLANRSPGLLSGYAWLMGLWSAGNQMLGRDVPATHYLLRAARALGDDAFPDNEKARLHELIGRFCRRPNGDLLPIKDNRLLQLFRGSQAALRIRAEFASYALDHRVRMRYPREPEDPERQGDLLLLKRPDVRTGERGVILVQYSDAIERFLALFDVSAMARDYSIVLEPSSWGYQDVAYLRYIGSDLDVIVQAQWKGDYAFLQALRSNLSPIRIGAGDWTDPELFTAGPKEGRHFDLALVSQWSPIKRHVDLFRALSNIRTRHGRSLTAALVGYPGGWTRQHIERLMRDHGVEDCCTIFEAIRPDEVAGILRDSRAYVLLSRREGANKALYEALFSDTPVVVYRHHRGVNTDDVGSDVGVLFDDGTLESALLEAVDGGNRFQPRIWALQHTGFYNATARLNELLRTNAQHSGRPWTRDITATKNMPNHRYVRPGEYLDFAGDYTALQRFLLPSR